MQNRPNIDSKAIQDSTKHSSGIFTFAKNNPGLVIETKPQLYLL